MADILIIDDDTFICKAIQKQMQNNGFSADVAFNAKTGLKLVIKNNYNLVFCDFRLPDKDGLSVLKEIKKINQEITVVIITAYADVRMAVKLMKQGAFDYITKPLQHEEMVGLVKKIVAKKKEEGKSFTNNEDFLRGESQSFKQAVQFAKKVAPTNMSVLIEGETGTGKEYMARFIHHNSKRKSKPFIAVDCGAIPKELAGSELFGHVKGSFTGAINDKTGVFQLANGGTLFLDEIGNLSYSVQVQLLRALQEKVVTRIGENKLTKVDVRIISATNEGLQQIVDNNQFREDLMHRINEFKIVLPPLRERKEDIKFFAEQFLKQSNKELQLNVQKFSTETLNIFNNYDWHGNIRELKNVVKRSVLLTSNDVVTPDTIPAEVVESSTKNKVDVEIDEGVSGVNKLKNVSSEMEKQLIIKTIEDAGYNKSKAARELNIDRKTLYNKIKQYGIEI